MKEREPVGLAVEVEKRPDRLVYGQMPVLLQLDSVNPFFDGQIRRVYEHDGIAALGDSLAENDLMHQLTVVELAYLDAVEYVSGINELWDTNHSASQLQENDEGNYYILIAGHRRLLGIYHNLEQSGHNQEDIKVLCSVRRGCDLTEALRLQYTENIHKAVEPSRDALAIQLYFNRRAKESEETDGKRFSYAQCARELGVSPKRVKDAESYFTLPAEVRKTVDAGLYSYNWVLKLTEFHEAIKTVHPDWSEADRAYELTAVLINSRQNDFSAKSFERYLAARAEGLLYEQQILVLSDEVDTPRKRADRAAEAMIRLAAENIAIGLGHVALGQVSDFRDHPVVRQQVAEVQEVIARLSRDTASTKAGAFSNSFNQS